VGEKGFLRVGDVPEVAPLNVLDRRDEVGRVGIVEKIGVVATQQRYRQDDPQYERDPLPGRVPPHADQ
jgi:hypothetical protein